MNKVGLKTKFDHMLGLPGENIEAQATALDLYRAETPRRIQVFWTSFLPGTELMKEGLEQGIINQASAERLNEGLDFYFFRNVDSINNPELVDTYHNYEFLFKSLPLMPFFIRKRIMPKHISWVPKSLMLLLMNAADLITGFWWGNADFNMYLRYYIFHLKRFAIKKTGLKIPSATRANKKYPEFSAIVPTE
jgi:hypothetical protein